MKQFVTGAAGFIGSNYVRHVLATTDDTVTMILTYLVMLGLFLGPIAIVQYLQQFENLTENEISLFTITSPFAAIFAVPLYFKEISTTAQLPSPTTAAGLPIHWFYLGFAVIISIVLLVIMDVLFRLRWRAASQGSTIV